MVVEYFLVGEIIAHDGALIAICNQDQVRLSLAGLSKARLFK